MNQRLADARLNRFVERSESLADLDFSTRRRRTMTVHQPILGHRALDLVRVLLIIAAAIAVMLIATAIFGVQGTGEVYDIVPDPAGVSIPY
ncbi:MAG: hypothetical protein A2Z32_09455 [Chloroflexi bacterium RBG_16_69_14]|nr:MAG: hypothetical protein A2Z32_09455 [Chloroflexi bacterium RBG_16_69_14]